MAEKPAEPSPATGGSRGGRGGGQEQPRELVGELALARYVKDDGRALLLYSRPEREQT